MEKQQEKYQEFFNKLAKFKALQNQQRRRGLNDYNPLSIVLKINDEVRLHSRMLHSFLDPNGEHYQGSLFLDKFLEGLGIKEFNFDAKNALVSKEHNNMDLYISKKTNT